MYYVPFSRVHSKGMMWQIMEDLSRAANVSLQRLNIYKVESNAHMPGMKVYLAIYTSPASGSGIPGIDPIGSRDVAEDLIAQVKLMLSPLAAASCQGEYHLAWCVCSTEEHAFFSSTEKYNKKSCTRLFCSFLP